MTLAGIGLLAVLVILLIILPVSGAGKTGLRMVTGISMVFPIQIGQDQAGYGYGSGNGSCIRENCPNNGVRPLDGTGMHHHAGPGSGMVDDQIPTDMGMATGSDLLFFKFPVNIGRSDFFVSSKVSRPQTRAHLRLLLKYR